MIKFRYFSFFALHCYIRLDSKPTVNSRTYRHFDYYYYYYYDDDDDDDDDNDDDDDYYYYDYDYDYDYY